MPLASSQLPVPSHSALLPQEIHPLGHPLYPLVSKVTSKSLLLFFFPFACFFNCHVCGFEKPYNESRETLDVQFSVKTRKLPGLAASPLRTRTFLAYAL